MEFFLRTLDRDDHRPRLRALTSVVVVLALVASACTSGDDGGSADGSGRPGDGEVALPEAEPWPEGTWAGTVEGTDAFVALVAGPGGVVAYVCDDEEIAEWFGADVAAGATVLDGADGVTMVAEPDGTDLVGTVQLPGVGPAVFRAEPAGDDAVHRAFGFDEEDMATIGWITLPSGEQRGALRIVQRLVPPRAVPSPPVPVAPRPAPTTTTVPPPARPTTSTTRPTTSTTRPTTSTTRPPAPAVRPVTPAPPPVIKPAPPLRPTQPVSIAKPSERTTQALTNPLLTLPPPNPLTPDAVGSPTPNNTNFVWAAIGDSYASGEGAPVTPGGADFGQARPNWGPADAEAGISLDDRLACHRSTNAGGPVANQALRGEFPEVTFHFAHYACSGAKTTDLMQRGYLGPDRHVQVEQAAQGESAAQFAAAPARGAYDALYMGIGGNDAGFGAVIQDCLIGLACHEGTIDVDGAPIEQRLAELPGRYRALNDYLYSAQRPARPKVVIIPQIPEITSGPDGQTCGADVGRLAGEIELLNLITGQEATWARDVVLAGMNDAIAGTASLGWQVMDGHLAAFNQRGYCAGNGLINTNNTALATQGDDYALSLFGVVDVRNVLFVAAVALAAVVAVGAGAAVAVGAQGVKLSSGILHPTTEGHAAYGAAITDLVRPLVDQKLADGLEPPRRVRVASAERDRSLTFRWDDLSTSEDRYEVTVTRLEGTGSVPSEVVVLPAGAQEVRIDARGPVAVRVEVRACVRSTCSEPGVGEGANFPPAVPTDGIGGYVAVQFGPPFNRSDVSANAGWLPSKYALIHVIEFRQVDPSSTQVRQLTPRLPFGGLVIADPDFGSNQGNPKALYLARISACNRAGCSVFSSEVEVDARGEPEIVDLSSPTGQVRVPLAEVLLDGSGRLAVGPTLPARPGDPVPGQPGPSIPEGPGG